MVARDKIKERCSVFLSFSPESYKVNSKLTGFPAYCILVRLPIPINQDSDFMVPKLYLQFTAAGTATEFNSIPMHQFCSVKVNR